MNFDLLREIVKDLIGGVDLGVVVQVGVDVAGGADVAVAEPFLNVLEGYAVGVEQGRTGVPLGYNNDKTGNPYGTRVLSNSGC